MNALRNFLRDIIFKILVYLCTYFYFAGSLYMVMPTKDIVQLLETILISIEKKVTENPEDFEDCTLDKIKNKRFVIAKLQLI